MIRSLAISHRFGLHVDFVLGFRIELARLSHATSALDGITYKTGERETSDARMILKMTLE